MARALLHQDPESLRLLGVWVDKDKAYYRATVAERMAGKSAMEDQRGGTWDEWVDRLTSRNPGTICWESAEVEKGESPQALFKRLTT